MLPNIPARFLRRRYRLDAKIRHSVAGLSHNAANQVFGWQDLIEDSHRTLRWTAGATPEIDSFSLDGNLITGDEKLP
jgi:hypothetical protein